MDTRSKSRIKALITKVILNIYCLGIKKSVNDHFEDTLDPLHGSIAQTPQPGPSTSTTPKVLKKKGYRRIEIIPENDIINIDNTVSDSTAIHDKAENKNIKTGNVVETTIGRAKREASRKATANIKKQRSMSVAAKLRGLLTLDSNINVCIIL